MVMPSYAGMQAQKGRNITAWDKFTQHAPGVLGGAVQGGLGAYNIQQGLAQQQQQQPQQPQVQGPLNKPQPGIPIAQDTANQQNSMQQLAQMLQQATSHKVGQMSQSIPPNPQRWQQQANQAVEETNQPGSQPPQWGGNAPGFAFSDYLGASSQINPLEALGDLGSAGSASAQSDSQDKSWWRKAANIGGKVASTVAPLAGAFGPPGLAVGAGLGALGYLGQQA